MDEVWMSRLPKVFSDSVVFWKDLHWTRGGWILHIWMTFCPPEALSVSGTGFSSESGRSSPWSRCFCGGSPANLWAGPAVLQKTWWPLSTCAARCHGNAAESPGSAPTPAACAEVYSLSAWSCARPWDSWWCTPASTAYRTASGWEIPGKLKQGL